jgi:membrane protein implicated in regulation of membrane protease activity
MAVPTVRKPRLAMVIVWIVLTVSFVLIEMHHLAFFAMFVAVGSAAAAAVALAAPGAVGMQVVVALVVSVLGLVAMRPWVSHAFALRRHGTVIYGVHGGLVGSTAVALDEVSTSTTGHVRLVGETWLAVAADGSTIDPGASVIVTAVSGTTLAVVAVDALSLPAPLEGNP